MERKPLIATGVAVSAVAVGGGALTHAMSGTESTTGLDKSTTVTVDGHKALSGNIVAGRTSSKYSPLPWIGGDTSVMKCPDLKAVAGAKVTCTGPGPRPSRMCPAGPYPAGQLVRAHCPTRPAFYSPPYRAASVDPHQGTRSPTSLAAKKSLTAAFSSASG
ncbi:hypothetical protein GCM10010234_11920 [Streptomyces hawaiiensis]